MYTIPVTRRPTRPKLDPPRDGVRAPKDVGMTLGKRAIKAKQPKYPDFEASEPRNLIPSRDVAPKREPPQSNAAEADSKFYTNYELTARASTGQSTPIVEPNVISSILDSDSLGRIVQMLNASDRGYRRSGTKGCLIPGDQEVTRKDVADLFSLGIGGTACMQMLEQYCEERLEFSSMADLIDRLAADRKKLVGLIGVILWSQGSDGFQNMAREEQDDAIGSLLRSSMTGKYIFKHLRNIKTRRRKFEDLEALGECVRAMQADVLEAKAGIRDLLHSFRLGLATASQSQVPLDDKNIDKLYRAAGSDDLSVVIVETVLTEVESCDSFADLLSKVRGKRSGLVADQKEAQNKTRRLLCSMRHLVLPEEALNSLDHSHLKVIQEVAGGADNVREMLQQMSDAQLQYADFGELVQALDAKYQQFKDKQRTFVAYLGSPHCRLFIPSLRSRPSVFHVRNVFQDLTADTLGYLALFEEQGRRFASLSELLEAITKEAANNRVSRDAEERMLWACLTKEPRVLHGQCFQDDARAILQVGCGFHNTMSYVEYMRSTRLLHTTLTSMLGAIRNLHTRSEAVQKQLIDWLKSPDCGLLRDALHPVSTLVTTRAVERLYIQGGACVDTLEYLTKLNRMGKKFKSMHELARAVNELHQDIINTASALKTIAHATEEAERGESTSDTGVPILEAKILLDTWMTGVPSPSSRASMAGMESEPGKTLLEFFAAEGASLCPSVPVLLVDVRQLLRQSSSEQELLPILRELQAEGQTYGMWDQLMEAVRKRQERRAREQEEALKLLARRPSELFTDDVVAESLDKGKMQRLLKESGATGEIMRYLWSFMADGHRFDSFEELLKAVCLLHRDKVCKQQILQKTLTKILTNIHKQFQESENAVANAAGDTDDAEVETDAAKVFIQRVLRYGSDAGTTMAVLKQMRSEVFSGEGDFIRTFRRMHTLFESEVSDVHAFLRADDQHLLIPAVKVSLTFQEVEQLLGETQGHMTTLPILKQLAQDHRQFLHFVDLIIAVKAATIALKFHAKDILHLLRSSQIFQDSESADSVTEKQITRMFIECESGLRTLQHIYSIQQRELLPVDDFDQLTSLVREEEAEFQERVLHDRKRLLAILRANHTNKVKERRASLFAQGSQVQLARLSELPTLFYDPAVGLGAGMPQTMDVITAVGGDADFAIRALLRLIDLGYLFDSFDDLIDALRKFYFEQRDARLAIEEHLLGPSSPLLEGLMLGRSTVLQLEYESGAWPTEVMKMLRLFAKRKRRFHSVKQCSQEIRASYLQEEAELKKQEQKLQELLADVDSPLLAQLVMTKKRTPAALRRKDLQQVHRVGQLRLTDKTMSRVASLKSPGSPSSSEMIHADSGNLELVESAESTSVHLLAVFKRRERVFESVDALTEALQDLQYMYLVVKQKALLLLKFSGPPCDPEVLEEEVHRLVFKSGVGPYASKYLEGLLAGGRPFDSLESLLSAARTAHSDRQHINDSLSDMWTYLNSDESPSVQFAWTGTNCTWLLLHTLGFPASFEAILPYLRRIGSHGPFLAVKDVADAVRSLYFNDIRARKAILHFLTNPQCNLFSEAPFPVQINVANVEALLKESQHGMRTIESLWLFNAANRKFSGFPDLMEALEVERRERAEQVQSMHDYLANAGSALLDGWSLNESEISHFARGSSRFSRLSVISTVDSFRKLSNSTKRFSQFDELQEGLTGVMTSAAAELAPTHNFLTARSCRLLPRSLQLQQTDIVRLCTSGLERHTPLLLMALQDKGLQFDTLEELVAVVAIERQNIQAHLAGPICYMFRDSDEDISVQDIARLYADGGAGADTISIIKHFYRRGLSFEDVDDLSEAVASQAASWGQTRRDVLAFFWNPSCTLLREAVEMGPAEVDRLMEAAGGGLGTLESLQSMEDSGAHFDTVNAIVKALDLEEGGADHQAKGGLYQDLLHYLEQEGGSSALFGAQAAAAISWEDGSLRVLARAAKSTADSIFWCKRLEESGARFVGVAHLAATLQALCSGTLKGELLDYLQSADVSLLAEGAKGALDDNSITMLLLRGGAAGSTRAYLTALQTSGQTFEALDELARAVNRAHRETLVRTWLLLRQWGEGVGDLKEDQTSAVALWLKTGCSTCLLSHLRELREQSKAETRFPSAEKLAEAVLARHV